MIKKELDLDTWELTPVNFESQIPWTIRAEEMADSLFRASSSTMREDGGQAFLILVNRHAILKISLQSPSC